MKELLKKNAHWFLLLYFPLYLAAFYLIEHRASYRIHIIESTLDEQIPFIEYFIVPYLLWFFYIAAGVIYFLLLEKESYKRLMAMLMIGMTVFILVSMILPNGLQLRPVYFEHDNIFVDMTRMLYSLDTATNVFPSIHVFNSAALHTAVVKSPRLKENRLVVAISLVLCVSIILSTMFLKQHSVFDVMSGMVLFCLSYGLVYHDLGERVPVHNTSASIYNHK